MYGILLKKFQSEISEKILVTEFLQFNMEYKKFEVEPEYKVSIYVILTLFLTVFKIGNYEVPSYEELFEGSPGVRFDTYLTVLTCNTKQFRQLTKEEVRLCST